MGRAIARASGGAFGRAPDCALRRAPIGATARQLRAPETLDGCTYYLRPLDASHRLDGDAAALCERLRRQVDTLVDLESHDGERLLNRLTPPG